VRGKEIESRSENFRFPTYSIASVDIGEAQKLGDVFFRNSIKDDTTEKEILLQL